jgi:hypothetical protein
MGDRADRDSEIRSRQALNNWLNRQDRRWDFPSLQQAATDIQEIGGLGQILREGDVLPVPTSWVGEGNIGLPGFSTAPDMKSNVIDWARSQGMDLPTYQARYQSLPYKFNPDGTMTLSAAEMKNPIIYNNDNFGAFGKYIAPTLFGGMALGGLTGWLPGTESIFGGAAGTAAGGGAAELASMADLGSSMLGESIGSAAAGGGAAVSGLEGALNFGDPFIDAYTPIGTGGGATGLPSPGAVANAASGAASGAPTNANALSQLIKKVTGLDVDPSALGMLGTGLSTLLGAYGSNKQTDALKDIANRSDAQRAPALAAFNNALANPNTWYQSAPAMGALDSALAKLSVQHGNPALDPGALSKAAAYNLGGYNDFLRTMGNLGLSGQDTSAKLQTNAVMSGNNLYNALGSGIASLTSNQPTFQMTIQQALDKYFKNQGSGILQ